MSEPHTSSDTQSDDRPWYEDAFGQRYLQLYPKRDQAQADEQIAQLIGWRQWSKSDRILDVGCGAGRHMLALRHRGYHVFGVDLSQQLLRQAREEELLRDRLIQADMRQLPCVGVFDCVMSLFTSFGYFEDIEEDQRALQSMADALKPGGQWIMDHIHAAHLREHLQRMTVEERGDMQIHALRKIENDFVTKQITITLANGQSEQFFERVRLYDPDELERRLNRAGLSVQQWAGGLDGRTLDDSCDRMVVLATKQ